MARQKRAQIILDDYLREIVEGRMPEGALLPTESSLVETYGVSRTAVREAIQALAAKGFVSIRQGSGTSVAPRSHWNVLDPDYLHVTGFGQAIFDNLMETRDIVEPALAGLAARRALPEQVERLRGLVTALGSVRAGDHARHADVDVGFHEALAECSANPVLISLHASITQLSRAQRQFMAGDAAAVQRAIFWHQHIVDAVARHDPAAAEDAMRMHLRQVQLDLAALSPRDAEQYSA